MLKQYEELSVLEQGDDGAVISIRGQEGPSILLTSGYLGHLQQVIGRAEAEMSRSPESVALRVLCSEVRTLLATYDETCNKYYGAPPPTKLLAEAMAELEELRRLLNAV